MAVTPAKTHCACATALNLVGAVRALQDAIRRIDATGIGEAWHDIEVAAAEVVREAARP